MDELMPSGIEQKHQPADGCDTEHIGEGAERDNFPDLDGVETESGIDPVTNRAPGHESETEIVAEGE